MKQERSDIPILLTVLLLFSASIGLLHGGRKKKEVHTKHFEMDATRKMLPEQIFKYLKPFLFSHRKVEMLSNAINNFPENLIHELASMIIYDIRSPLTKDDKRELLFMLACQHSTNKALQFKLFDLVVDSQVLDRHTPLLLDVAKSNCAAVLPILLAWTKHKKIKELIKWGGGRNTQASLIHDALYGAIAENDLHILEMLNAYGVRIEPEQASNLLVRVIYDQKNIDFIPFLIKRGANVNIIGPDNYTLLSKAVFNNDIVAARILLESGANINATSDAESAMYIAKTYGLNSIEKLLQEYQARK